MDKLEELQKAIDEAAMAGVLMLRKSQMSFDFTAPNPHHVAYTRTNASGTVSNIAAKGVPREKAIKTFRAGYMRAKIDHDNRQHGEQSSPHYRAGREAGSESTAATDHRAAYRAHLAKHPRQNTQTGEWEPMMSSVKGEGEFADGFHASLEEKKRDAHYDAGYKTGQKHIEAGIHQEIGGTWGDAWEKHAAKHYPASQPAAKGAPNPKSAWANDRSKDAENKNTNSAHLVAAQAHDKAAAATTGEQKTYHQQKAAAHRSKASATVALQSNERTPEARCSGCQPDEGHGGSIQAEQNAAKDLKSELESDDFGMTEKGGNGRVKMRKDGTVSVYDSTYYGADEALAKHVKKWSPGGTEHNYFKAKGYNIEVVGTDKEFKSKVFGGRLGHVAVHLKVTKP